MKIKIILPSVALVLFGVRAESSSPDQEEVIKAAALISARESARIQFERDIGLAEAEVEAAREAMHAEARIADKMRTRALEDRYFPAATLQAELELLRSTVDVFEEKKAKRDLLRAEAERLHIPVSKVEKPPTLKPSFAPVRNRANDPIVLKPAKSG